MALLRSDVINKELIDQVLRKIEGTNRVVLSSLTVKNADSKASLLEERLNIQVNAFIRGRSKDYDWIAKVLRSESGPANYARFQGLLETEVNFYEKLLKDLNFPPPRTLPYLWGNYQSLNREVLLLEHDSAFQNPQSNGLDLPHVLLAVEWLAKLHALSYVAKKNFEAKNPDKDWLLENPWIKKEIQDLGNDAKTLEEIKGDSVPGLKARLVSMAKKALQMESSDSSKLEELMERQNWLDQMRTESQKEENSSEKSFMCVLHGQPWSGNVLYSYDNEQNPMEIIFTDFQSCSYGRAGQDIAHFLLASTDREFRKNHLETILTAYLTELEDVLNHQGIFDGPLYSPSALRRDYKRGIYSGITFCLFAMPMLNSKEKEGNNDEVDGQEMNLNLGLERAKDALLDYYFM